MQIPSAGHEDEQLYDNPNILRRFLSLVVVHNVSLGVFSPMSFPYTLIQKPTVWAQFPVDKVLRSILIDLILWEKFFLSHPIVRGK